MPVGLDAATIARLVARHGSLPAAWQNALRDPQFEQELRAVGVAQVMSRSPAENAAATAKGWELVAAWDLLATAGDEPQSKRPEGLEDDVARRLAAGEPTEGELTQRKIAERYGVSRRQVRNVEAELSDGRA